MFKRFRKRKDPEPTESAEPEVIEATPKMKADALFAAAESLSIAHFSRADNINEKQQQALWNDWARVLTSMESSAELQLYVWAALNVSAASIEALIEYVRTTQEVTMNIVSQILELPEDEKDIIYAALPQMADYISFESFVQNTTLQAMEMAEGA